MEDYLIPKASSFVPTQSIAQPLTLIPEIAEIDKMSDKGGKDKTAKSPDPPTPVVERVAPRPVKYQPVKTSYNTPLTKGATGARQASPDDPEFRSLKAKVVSTLEEKWSLIAQISAVQKEDEKTLEILRKIEVK